MSAPAFRVFAHLSRRQNKTTGRAWPGVDSIAKKCRLNRKTVINAIRELEQHGLEAQRVTGSRTRYVIPTLETFTGPFEGTVTPVRNEERTSPNEGTVTGPFEGTKGNPAKVILQKEPPPPPPKFRLENGETDNQAIERLEALYPEINVEDQLRAAAKKSRTEHIELEWFANHWLPKCKKAVFVPEEKKANSREFANSNRDSYRKMSRERGGDWFDSFGGTTRPAIESSRVPNTPQPTAPEPDDTPPGGEAFLTKLAELTKPTAGGEP